MDFIYINNEDSYQKKKVATLFNFIAEWIERDFCNWLYSPNTSKPRWL